MPHAFKPVSGRAIRLSASAVRAAEITPTMPYVLGASLLLSSTMMSLAWIIPALPG